MEGICIDNIRVNINSLPDFEYLKTALRNWNPKHDTEGRVISASGSLSNLKVYVGLDLITVSGSPARYCHTANAFPFGPAEMQAFIERIASQLHLPVRDVMDGTTNVLDVALNVVTNHSPRAYFPLLLDMPRTSRMEAESTLYFKNQTRKARIYDKVRELSQKGLAQHLSEEQGAASILRIEFSTSAAKKDFGSPVTLADLADPSFWPRVHEFWLKHFRSIKQTETSSPSARAGTFPCTAAALRDYYAAIGIHATGGISEAMASVREQQSAGAVRPDQASRMRKMLSTLGSGDPPTCLSELGMELNSGVNRVLTQDAARVSSGQMERSAA